MKSSMLSEPLERYASGSDNIFSGKDVSDADEDSTLIRFVLLSVRC